MFAADYDGAEYTDQRWGEEPVDVELTSFREFIDLCLRLRRDLGDAEQEDHFDRHDVISWVRRTARLTVVVLVGNAGETSLEVQTGRPRRRFTEVTGAVEGRVQSRASGAAVFPVPGGGVTIWVSRAGRRVAR